MIYSEWRVVEVCWLIPVLWIIVVLFIIKTILWTELVIIEKTCRVSHSVFEEPTTAWISDNQANYLKIVMMFHGKAGEPWTMWSNHKHLPLLGNVRIWSIWTELHVTQVITWPTSPWLSWCPTFPTSIVIGRIETMIICRLRTNRNSTDCCGPQEPFSKNTRVFKHSWFTTFHTFGLYC